MSIPQFFESDRAGIEEALDRLLPKEEAQPASIHKAMRYSVFAGGKRIRPILCLEAAAMSSENPVAAVSAGCALEFIRAYSLIHDDLPALDNDDFRRGKPTCHKVFGEAIAILAGDALLTLAFQTLAFVPVEPQRRLNILAAIAQAAGRRRIDGGQVADLEAEKKAPDWAPSVDSPVENGRADSRLDRCGWNRRRRNERRCRASETFRRKYWLGFSGGGRHPGR